MTSGAPGARTLAIEFTGSGAEYFRIWIVNLLFIVLSCGLYLPFAKLRRMRYFHANTLIDGDALAFHGHAGPMFRGFVLLAALMLAYTLAGQFAPAAALPAFVLLCLVWPALWRASMQFRLGNTSWRGLRLGFDGTLRGAYLAYVPIAAPMALAAWPTPQGGPLDPWILAPPLATVLALPWSTTLVKRYQHRGYRIAGERSTLRLGVHEVYAIGIQATLLGALLVLAAFVCTGMVEALSGLDRKAGSAHFGLVLVGTLYLFGGAIVLPWCAARLQNRVWGRTGSSSLRFHSQLTGLARLTLKNWLLILATAGLYRPFAVIATTRLRLQAVRIETTTEPDTWSAPPPPARSDASGDAAGDFFGADVGL